MAHKLPDFSFEERLWRDDYLVVGVDEVGRGCLSGPVHIGAVCFDSQDRIKLKTIAQAGINDSKQLTPGERTQLADFIRSHCLSHQIKSRGVAFINKKGIVASIQSAVREAINAFQIQFPDRKIFLLLDAFPIKYIKGIGLKRQHAIIRGDQQSITIAAASIIAKVQRDRLMTELDQKFPQYGWKRNKGYGTKEHLNALSNYGSSRLHRALFIRNLDLSRTS